MADEILIKARLDTDQLAADFDQVKKLGNAAIQEIEKNDLFAKANANAKDLKKSLELIVKASGDIRFDNANLDEVINDSKKLKELIVSLTQSLKGMKQGTTEFNALDAIIKSANTQLTKLTVTSESTGKSLRTQMRLAQQEVAELSAKFGATSEQAIKAAKRASELKDTIGDARALTDAFNPDAKFNALSKSITGLASGFSAVQGAMGLIGSESEDVQKTLLKVQSALALSQGLQGLGEAKDSFVQLKAVAIDAFKGIKSAIGSTGIGLLVVALGTVVAYWDDIKEAITGVSGKIKENADLARKDLEIQDKLLSSLNDQDEILKAQGLSERKILEIKRQKLLVIYETKKADLQAILEVERAELESTKRRREGLFKYLGIYGQVFEGLDLFNVKKAQEDFDKIEAESKASLIKIENQIAGYENNIRTLDKKTNEEKKKENDKYIEDKKKKEKELAEQKAKDLEFEANSRAKFNAVMNEKELQDLADKNKAEKDLLEAGFADLDKYIQAEDKLKKEAADKEKARQQELIDKQKQAVNDLLDFAQNGILLQIGLNPQDVSNVRRSVENFISVLDDQAKTTEEKWAAGAMAAQAAYQTVSNAIFNADTERRQQEIAELQTQKEEEIRLAGDNEQKKEVIRQKYALKEKEIKRKQAEADKRKSLFDAYINTAVAVITGFVKGGPILAAIAAALGAAQIALIAATPIPKFAKGVVSFDGKGGLVKGEGTGTSDSNLAYLSKGESVIPAAPTSANLGLINELVNGDVDTYINRHYVIPALQAKESKAAQNYRHSVIEAENNLIARVSSHTLKSIHKEQRNTTEAIKRLDKKDFKW